MRRISIAIGAVMLMLGGAGTAVERVDVVAGVGADRHVIHVQRYAFGQMGRSAEQAAADRCPGGQASVPKTQRTAGDVAAAVFTGGWYTPMHLMVECVSQVGRR